MPDREKVIKGLECAIGIRGRKNCDDCPYDNDFNCIGCDIVMRDALALIKEQEAEWLKVDDKHDAFDCSNCGAMAGRKCLYCPGCGAKMKNGTRAMEGR